jgi:putative ABC transport system permease protein
VEQGRWLLPGEGRSLVVTANLLRDEPDLHLGDTVRLKIRDRTTDWTLVGIVQSPTMDPYLYVGADALGAVTGEGGRAGVIVVSADPSSTQSQADFATALRDRLESAGIAVSGTNTRGNIVGTITTLFDTLVIIVSVMAVLLGVVGGLGLAGTMTMNVVERAREIGVLRAVGATDRAVLQIFLAEGAVVGLLGWMLGALVAIPIGAVLCDAIGNAFVQHPLSSSPSVVGIALWLVVVLVLSALGSMVPAWRASRLSVREVLAYE